VVPWAAAEAFCRSLVGKELRESRLLHETPGPERGKHVQNALHLRGAGLGLLRGGCAVELEGDSRREPATLRPALRHGGTLRGIKELARPGSYEFPVYGQGGSTRVEEEGAVLVDPDGVGPAQAFRLYDSDFANTSIRGTSVPRWEYRAGSSLILAWTHDRYA
jgi:hypothetical protein